MDDSDDDVGGMFPKPMQDINFIIDGPDSYESKGKQKLKARDMFVMDPATLEFLGWPEVPITLDRLDHPDLVSQLGWYPLFLHPTVEDARVYQVLIDGRSSLNILFVETFKKMVLSEKSLKPSPTPFYVIILWKSTTSLGR